MDTGDPVAISQQYLDAVRRGDKTRDIRNELAVLPKNAITTLSSDAERLSFWVNLYNAATHDALHEKPTALSNRIRFFYTPRIRVAGQFMSLNGVEHGILRRGKPSFLLGYGPTIPIRPFYRSVRPSKLDNRVHFLLNCGAESCPVVRDVDASSYQQIADEATEAYLQTECRWDDGSLVVPRLLRWYRGDFGGERGIRHLLEKYNIIDGDVDSITYDTYDWTPNPL